MHVEGLTQYRAHSESSVHLIFYHYYKKKFFFFIYFETEREKAQVGQEQRQREGESISSRVHAVERRACPGATNKETMT